jgi:hypothetical protein
MLSPIQYVANMYRPVQPFQNGEAVTFELLFSTCTFLSWQQHSLDRESLSFTERPRARSDSSRQIFSGDGEKLIGGNDIE